MNWFMPIVKSSGDAVHVACGSSEGSCYSKVNEKSTIEETHNVRCCSDSYKPGWTQRGGCNVWSESEINGMCVADVTFSTASLVCESVGGRLCTLEEVLGDCTRSLGCGFDQDLTWTSTTVDKSPEDKKVAAVCGASYGTCSVREQEALIEDLHEVRFVQTPTSQVGCRMQVVAFGARVVLAVIDVFIRQCTTQRELYASLREQDFVRRMRFLLIAQLSQDAVLTAKLYGLVIMTTVLIKSLVVYFPTEGRPH